MIPFSLVGFAKISEKIIASITEDRCIIPLKD